jgi:hypothetical protein
MIFDVMNFLYQSIPGMELMEQLRCKTDPCPQTTLPENQPALQVADWASLF